MVEIVDLKKQNLEFRGKVLDVSKEYSEDYNSFQFDILIEPSNKEWKNLHVWIPVPKNSTEERIQKNTALSEYVQALERVGITGETVTGTFKKMIDKTFDFVKQRLGHCKGERWVPKELVPEKKHIKIVRNPKKIPIDTDMGMLKR